MREKFRGIIILLAPETANEFSLASYRFQRTQKVYCDLPLTTSIRIRTTSLAFAVAAILNTPMRFWLIALTSCFLFCQPSSTAQEYLPAPPADQSLIYILDEQNKLVPLPFEAASTPLDLRKVARSTKTSYLEIKGDHAATTLGNAPRLFLFTPQRQGSHPPFLVLLTSKQGTRRATAIAQAGFPGVAISSDQIVKPTIRVLAAVGEVVFMEIRPRNSLVPGEYAIIGEDLTRFATFRVAADRMR
jgi:hypothetical protein